MELVGFGGVSGGFTPIARYTALITDISFLHHG